MNHTRALLLSTALTACASQGTEVLEGPDTSGFGPAREVTLEGYDESAMEPFVTRDGAHLFFNNRNDPAEQTDLFYATRVSPDTYRFAGPLGGANYPPPALDAVASMDLGGRFYFASTRSYEESLSTLYRGVFDGGVITSVELVPGDFNRRRLGWLTMDAEISPAGDELYFVSARFAGGAVPVESNIGLAKWDGSGFNVDADSHMVLGDVNTGALEYAPSIGTDGLELFFTRLTGTDVVILRAIRDDRSAPFGPPSRVEAAAGFVEAPSLSGEGNTLYFHKRVNGRFRIYLAER